MIDQLCNKNLTNIHKTQESLFIYNGTNLPGVQGSYILQYPLGRCSFFKCGGSADVLYRPSDVDDLIHFLKNKPQDLPVTVLGNLSNTLVTDKGVRGVVIDLRDINSMEFLTDTVKVDAGVQLSHFIHTCVNLGISCCENLYMIPSTIGGAIYMNAGVPKFEISTVVKSVDLVDIATGSESQISSRNMSYRNGGIPDGKIISSCILTTKVEKEENLKALLQTIRNSRKRKQPIGAKTCGCTFKNPPNNKAWMLIQEAGCAGMSVGDAIVSPVHNNFIINNGKATSSDILTLINNIKQQVCEKTGILLKEEIRIIGEL